MRILVVGAGATGGYFGGRLLEANQDVTFLVRPGRAAQLASLGLSIRSRYGDVNIANPPTVLAENLRDKFDLVLLSCKAYDLEDAITSFATAVGPATAVLPVLNGMHHLEVLDEQFGQERVLGGQCFIASTVNERHEIVHLNESHTICFGERDGKRSSRVNKIASVLAKTRFESRPSETIVQEMWAKWVFIASAAGITCMMRAAVGDIHAAGGAELTLALLAECASIANREGFPVGEASLERSKAMLTQPGSTLTASMLRDIEQGSRIEADHVVGDLIRHAQQHGLKTPLLSVVYTHLKAYEARRQRETSKTGKTV